jgi:hypothetical protein
MQIQNGIISENGKKVGKAFRDFKYSYHPAIKVEIGSGPKPHITWFELDEPDLLAKIADYAREHMHKS